MTDFPIPKEPLFFPIQAAWCYSRERNHVIFYRTNSDMASPTGLFRLRCTTHTLRQTSLGNHQHLQNQRRLATVVKDVLSRYFFIPKFYDTVLEAEFVAVASRNQETADEFGKVNGISKCYGSHDLMFADAEVDVVYVSTLNPFHKEPVIKALKAGVYLSSFLCFVPWY